MFTFNSFSKQGKCYKVTPLQRRGERGGKNPRIPNLGNV